MDNYPEGVPPRDKRLRTFWVRRQGEREVEVRNRMEKVVVPGEERTQKQFHVVFKLQHRGSREERINIMYKIFHTLQVYILTTFYLSHLVFVTCIIPLDHKV